MYSSGEIYKFKSENLPIRQRKKRVICAQGGERFLFVGELRSGEDLYEGPFIHLLWQSKVSVQHIITRHSPRNMEKEL